MRLLIFFLINLPLLLKSNPCWLASFLEEGVGDCDADVETGVSGLLTMSFEHAGDPWLFGGLHVFNFILFPPLVECLLISEGEFKSEEVLGEGNERFDVVLLGEPNKKKNFKK